MTDKLNNIPGYIDRLRGRNLHLNQQHPVGLVKLTVESWLGHGFEHFDRLDPVVSVAQNFDSLLIPPEHVCRRTSDTFWVDSDHVLRTHTSAHQAELLAGGHRQFLITGDCFRRDEIDARHYPVFHQIEGVRVGGSADDLLATVTGLMGFLFPDCESRVTDSYFPFTDPSWEIEILHEGRWIEVLGCGMVHKQILQNAVVEGPAWAFGVGLERLAMILFGIPDIRLMWSEDPRFSGQWIGLHAGFDPKQAPKFQPWSVFPATTRDVTFWVPEADIDPVITINNVAGIVREIDLGGLVESVEMVDQFRHPKTGRVSMSFRIQYRSWERTLVNGEINEIQTEIRSRLNGDGYVLR